MRVHIVGGGLAGLAAGLHLARAGIAVALYEAGPVCGGRCRSYFDRALGVRLDNGNHLLLSGNHAAMAYLASLETAGTLRGPATPAFPFLDLRDGSRWTLRLSAGRLPLWVFSERHRLPGTRARDYLPLGRLLRAGAADTVAGLAAASPVYERLIEPLAVAVLNTRPEEGSAQLLGRVLWESVARGGAACLPRFPGEGLSESFVAPAVEQLAGLGATIRTGSRIASLNFAGGRAVSLTAPDGDIDTAGDAVILAVPPAVAAELMPGVAAPDRFESILNLHFRAEAEPGEAGFVGLVGGLAEWVFVKPGVVSVTVSAANRVIDRDAESLAEAIWPEASRAVGLSGPMPPWRVVKEKRATFAATPDQARRRPGATTGVKNLYLAGDWTATGLPATIEGAIRSGVCAAEKLLRAA